MGLSFFQHFNANFKKMSFYGVLEKKTIFYNFFGFGGLEFSSLPLHPPMGTTTDRITSQIGRRLLESHVFMLILVLL